jgi:hypothetical protein
MLCFKISLFPYTGYSPHSSTKGVIKLWRFSTFIYSNDPQTIELRTEIEVIGNINDDMTLAATVQYFVLHLLMRTEAH